MHLHSRFGWCVVMKRLILIGVAAIAVTACDPANNPVMALGKEIGTADVPLQEHQVYFKEPVREVYDAVLLAGNRNDLSLARQDKSHNIAVISYDFSITKNVWGGSFRISLDSVDGRTRLVAHFYETSKYVTNSILNPFIDDIKAILSPTGRQAS